MHACTCHTTSSPFPIPFTHGAGSTTDPSEDVDSLDLSVEGGFGSLPDPELWSDSGELEPILCWCCSVSSTFLVRASISAVVWAWASTAWRRSEGERRERMEREERGRGKGEEGERKKFKEK